MVKHALVTKLPIFKIPSDNKLGADYFCVIQSIAGHLGFPALTILVVSFVTHTSIFTSDKSNTSCRDIFNFEQNVLLP